MYTELATKLSVVSGTNQRTPAVSLEGANAIQIDAVIFSTVAGSTITFTPELSNEMQNWIASPLSFTGNAVGFVSSVLISTGWRYARVQVSSSSATASIVSIGLNTSAQ